MNILGKISQFKVLRETQLGYVLENNNEEYFLHRNETNFRKLRTDDIVKAFVYADKKARLTATLIMPNVTVDKAGFGKVADIKSDFGLFINIGSSKDVLLSKDDLPEDISEWPIIDDKILCQLRIKGERLIAKMLNKDDMTSLNSDAILPINEKVIGYVYRITTEGINIVTENYSVVFVHKDSTRKKYRIGEEVNVKILQKNTDDYSGTLLEDKKETINQDKEKILEYLKSHYGIMSITENSDPMIIRKVFDISKKAFKIAIGGLYKEKLIEIHDDKILLL